jgi:hypothetical protein
MLRARDFVDARLYKTEEDVVQDALRHLLRARPGLRIHLTVHRYKEMKDILIERGIQPRLGAETLEEAAQEVQTLRDYFQDQP